MTSIPKPEYRQMRRIVREDCDGGRGAIRYEYYVLQRLHHVPTGVRYVTPDNGPPESKADVFSHADAQGAWFHQVRAEWRDVDRVDEAANPIV